MEKQAVKTVKAKTVTDALTAIDNGYNVLLSGEVAKEFSQLLSGKEN